MTERVDDVQGASAHRVNEAPEAEDPKDSSVEGAAYHTGREEGPCQRARASAVKCGTGERRARTLHRGQMSVSVNEAQEDPKDEGEEAALRRGSPSGWRRRFRSPTSKEQRRRGTMETTKRKEGGLSGKELGRTLGKD